MISSSSNKYCQIINSQLFTFISSHSLLSTNPKRLHPRPARAASRVPRLDSAGRNAKKIIAHAHNIIDRARARIFTIISISVFGVCTSLRLTGCDDVLLSLREVSDFAGSASISERNTGGRDPVVAQRQEVRVLCRKSGHHHQGRPQQQQHWWGWGSLHIFRVTCILNTRT